MMIKHGEEASNINSKMVEKMVLVVHISSVKCLCQSFG